VERHTRSYLRLIKPGITVSNTLAGIAGFCLAASVVGWNWLAFMGVVCGIALIIASACVVNNILDRDIDTRMKRTATREVASGVISVPVAAVFAACVGAIGFVLLCVATNGLTLVLGGIAYIWYVVIYGIAKRTTALSTIIGGVAGALPPVAGYTALTGSIDITALLLFWVLFFWQLPHFYAIAMFRRDDYASAKLPVWSVRYGMKSAKFQLFVTVVLYAVSTALLGLYSSLGVTYFAVSTGLSVYWVYKGVVLYKKSDDVAWAKAMFGVSLLVLMAMCALISVGGFLP